MADEFTKRIVTNRENVAVVLLIAGLVIAVIVRLVLDRMAEQTPGSPAPKS